MQMQHDFLADLQAKLENDARVLAAWLEGSFGRGSADRYSDIDLHLLLREAGAFHSDARAWLEVLRPLVLYKLLFDGRMINALTDADLVKEYLFGAQIKSDFKVGSPITFSGE